MYWEYLHIDPGVQAVDRHINVRFTYADGKARTFYASTLLEAFQHSISVTGCKPIRFRVTGVSVPNWTPDLPSPEEAFNAKWPAWSKDQIEKDLKALSEEEEEA